jgi:hypothetical protein
VVRIVRIGGDCNGKGGRPRVYLLRPYVLVLLEKRTLRMIRFINFFKKIYKKPEILLSRRKRRLASEEVHFTSPSTPRS